jgi:hypothetical protein
MTKVKTSAFSERVNGVTWFMVTVSDKEDIYEIFTGKHRSNKKAYEKALKLAQEYMMQNNLVEETA